MRDHSKTGKPTASRISGTGATALVLCLSCAPVFASSGIDTRCDDSTKYTLDIKADKYAIDVAIDEIVSETVRQDEMNLVATGQHEFGTTPLRSSLRLLPPDEAVLGRLFDESLSNASEAATVSPVNGSQAAPLAELKAPKLRKRPLDAEEKDSQPADDALPRVNTRLPGISDDDNQRYRQQMYRTDI